MTLLGTTRVMATIIANLDTGARQHCSHIFVVGLDVRYFSRLSGEGLDLGKKREVREKMTTAQSALPVWQLHAGNTWLDLPTGVAVQAESMFSSDVLRQCRIP